MINGDIAPLNATNGFFSDISPLASFGVAMGSDRQFIANS